MATVRITQDAAEVLRCVREQRSGELTLSIDTGCCEGTAPHLYEDYIVPYGSTEIGRAGEVPVFVPPHLASLYASAKILIDVVDEAASDAMSLETALGKRFVLRHESS
jgi:uncharacterized protein (DUF779 family)